MSTQSLARALFLLALSVALSMLVTAIQVREAHAQDMSAELEQFNAECFDSASEFLGTDACFEWAEQNIELENLLESIEKGCVLTDMYEDYSCKGPSAPSSSSSSAGEQEEVSELKSTPKRARWRAS